jgi:GNAT superfamily N-acetyltransferase
MTARTISDAAAPNIAVSFTTGSVDPAEIERFFKSTTVEGRQRRFHHAVSRMPEEEVEGLTREQPDRLNIYARDPACFNAIIGIASGMLTAPHVAEVAVWVADDRQGRGIGTRLLSELASRLRDLGVLTLDADIQTTNVAAMRLAAHLRRTQISRSGDQVHVRMTHLAGAKAHSSNSDHD